MQGSNRMEDIMVKIRSYLRKDEGTECVYNRVWEAIDEWFESQAPKRLSVEEIEKIIKDSQVSYGTIIASKLAQELHKRGV